MASEEIQKWIDNLVSNPEEFFLEMESKGVDFTKIDLDAKTLVRDRFGLDEDQFKSVEFVYWASYLIEKSIADAVSESERGKGATVMVDKMLDQLSFGNKITLISEVAGLKELVSMAWKINDLRNHVAHGRFDRLKYGGFPLSNSKGQIKLIADLMKSTAKKSE